MRDPEKNVTFVFYCYEKESADLKIRLRYDNLKQSEFFRSLLRMYISNDPLILPVVQKIKENTTAAGKNNLKRTRESFEQGNELMKELGLTNSDKNKIFDLILSELELEDYE